MLSTDSCLPPRSPCVPFTSARDGRHEILEGDLKIRLAGLGSDIDLQEPVIHAFEHGAPELARLGGDLGGDERMDAQCVLRVDAGVEGLARQQQKTELTDDHMEGVMRVVALQQSL